MTPRAERLDIDSSKTAGGERISGHQITDLGPEADRQRRAVHEAGHALVALALRGQVSGVTLREIFNKAGKRLSGGETAIAMIDLGRPALAAALGGVAATDAFGFPRGESAEGDFRKATALAAEYFGPASVQREVGRAYRRACRLLRDRRTGLAAFAAELDQRGELDRKQIRASWRRTEEARRREAASGASPPSALDSSSSSNSSAVAARYRI